MLPVISSCLNRYTIAAGPKVVQKMSFLTSLFDRSPPSSRPSLPYTKPLPRHLYENPIKLTASQLQRQNEQPDTTHYAQPRMVHHIDDGAVAALKTYYSGVIKASDAVLDFCSSWTSHLPDDLAPKTLIGYGLNATELQANEKLTSYHVKDLNAPPAAPNPTVPCVFDAVPDQSVDVVICNLSVDYLARPLEVFRDVERVLKPGGWAHFAFSNRCFPTKVVRGWLTDASSDEERRRWTGRYFWGAWGEAAGVPRGAELGWAEVEEVVLLDGRDYADPLYVVRGRKRRVGEAEENKEVRGDGKGVSLHEDD